MRVISSASFRPYFSFVTAAIFGATTSVYAFAKDGCDSLPKHEALEKALKVVVKDGNAGLFTPNKMWATIVDRSGTVCAVVKVGDAWPGSRIISAQKASTANGFSNDELALSTANLYFPTQPGGTLFGLQESNPVNATVAYEGSADKFGTDKDPLSNKRIGGVNVFGGGLALYSADGKKVLGGIGVSGDTSCTDHIIAWRLREALGFKKVPGGVANGTDNIMFDVDATSMKSKSGFGHPACSDAATKLALPLKIEKAG